MKRGLSDDVARPLVTTTATIEAFDQLIRTSKLG